MKQLVRVLCVLVFAVALARTADAQIDILGKVSSEVDHKVDESIDDALHPKKKEEPKKDDQGNSTTTNSAAGAPVNSAQTIKAYNNYDFKSGENIIFSDDFRDDVDGEFPAHWNLDAGQAVMNKVNGEPAFLITEGNYAYVSPRIKSESYLTDPFTIEFDYYQANSNQWAPMLHFVDDQGAEHNLHFAHHVSTAHFPHDLDGSDVFDDDQYYGKWHHGAMIYKADQMKVYIDNVRALVMPHCDFTPVKVSFGGIGDPSQPITFKNVRIASGGSQNMIGTILTDGKFVTHGITFDVAKATLRPESMGVLNEVAKFLKENSSVRLEVDGHTDSDGDENTNKKLSEDRAAAVKAQLVAMGIDASRLTTKGYGPSKPIAPNNTPEGKANNRRVEFVKL